MSVKNLKHENINKNLETPINKMTSISNVTKDISNIVKDISSKNINKKE